MPKEYGVRLQDLDGNIVKLVPDHMTVISAGRVTMPNVLNGDNTYGVDIALPVSNVPLADIGVIAVPVKVNYNTDFVRWTSGASLLYNTHYGKSASTYYTRNDANGVMSAFACGALTAGIKSAWNPVLSVYPTAFWDRMSQVNFNNVRIFGATAYCVRDTNDDSDFSVSASLSYTGNLVTGAWTGGDGTINNIRDNNPLDWEAQTGSGAGTGHGGYYFPGTEASNSVVMYEDFAAKTLNSIWINYYWDNENGVNYNGSSSTSIVVSLYIDSTWYDIFTFSSSGATYGTDNAYVYGHWKNVTRIRATINTHTQCYYAHADTLWAWGLIGDLHGYGPNYDDSVENKLIYSIGNQGVEEVDYLVCMKKYNP
jgi:hypothetical protein